MKRDLLLSLEDYLLALWSAWISFPLQVSSTKVNIFQDPNFHVNWDFPVWSKFEFTEQRIYTFRESPVHSSGLAISAEWSLWLRICHSSRFKKKVASLKQCHQCYSELKKYLSETDSTSCPALKMREVCSPSPKIHFKSEKLDVKKKESRKSPCRILK